MSLATADYYSSPLSHPAHDRLKPVARGPIKQPRRPFPVTMTAQRSGKARWAVANVSSGPVLKSTLDVGLLAMMILTRSPKNKGKSFRNHTPLIISPTSTLYSTRSVVSLSCGEVVGLQSKQG